MVMLLNGIGVNKGIAIGKAFVFRRDESDIGEYIIPKPLIEEEVTRFRSALRKTRQQLKKIRDQIPPHAPAELASFIDTHLLMLDDTALSRVPVAIIREQQCNAEWALKQQRDVLIGVFEAMDDPYLRTRKDDIDQVVNRIQDNLLHLSERPHEIPAKWLKGRVVVADDLAPADTMQMQQQGVAAFVTEFGGPNSHTAIMARSLGIPAIVGVHSVQRYIRHNELVIIDGRRGLLYASPDKQVIDYYRKQQRNEKYYLAELSKLKEKPAVTRDGKIVALMANVELVGDLPAIRRVAAAGVGLYRTEMLFINRADLPDEEEQYQAYLAIVRALKGKVVTIRTLDLGADKQLDSGRVQGSSATNPALGLRAIRLCLKDQQLFRPQLRAILRVSAHGPVRMMIPMLSSVEELIQTLQVIEEEKQVLLRQGIAFNSEIPIGGMIEVPAAALAADVFARHLDFLSLGTNDLIQYTLAADRMDDAVNYLCDPLHPAILRLIAMTIIAARKANIPVSMCGEMAGDTRYTRLLLGMGLREFSMYAASLLEVKRIINASEIALLEREARKVLRLTRQEEIAALVEKINAL